MSYDRFEIAVLTTLAVVFGAAFVWLLVVAISYGVDQHCLGQVLLAIAAGVVIGPGGFLLFRWWLSRW